MNWQNTWCDSASKQLQDEVAVVIQRHQSELKGCFDKWLQQQQQLFQDAKVSLPLPGSSIVSFHSPTESSNMADVLTELGVVPGSTAEHQKPQNLSEVLAPPVHSESKLLLNGQSHSPQLPTGLMKSKTDSKAKNKKRSLLHGDKSLFTESYNHTLTRFQTFVRSKKYEVFSTTLIIANSIFVGWHVQYMAERARDDAVDGSDLSAEPLAVFVIQTMFVCLFTLELGLRWASAGLFDFWVSLGSWEDHYLGIRGFRDEISWNLLDFLIVTFGMFDFFMEVLARASDSEKHGIAGKVSILRVLRVIRIVRIARVIRVMRFFRELRMMIFSILGSMKSVIWVIAVLGMTFYIFGITFTAAVTSHLDTSDKWMAEENEPMILYFGTIDRSILSLYMAMSGGNDWGQYYDALTDLVLLYRILFLMFITFTVFAVVNIVTGVFVESAMQANTTDREIIVHEELQVRREFLLQMQQVFEEMDDDDKGTISLDEFEKKLSDERVIAYFSAMKLDVSEARVLFRLLDYDQSNEISIEEFLEGCYRFQGESRSLDMKIMQYEVRYLQESFSLFQEMLKSVHDRILPRSS